MLDNKSAQVQALAEGQKVTDTITVTVDDGNGGTATQVITVTITGTNDAAIITPSKPGDDAGSVKKTTSSPPAASWMSPTRTPAKPRSSPRPTSRAITASSRSMPTATGSTNRSRPLGVEKLVETFEVVTADGTKGTVTVTINGTNDAPVISGQASGEVTDGGNTSATGQLGKTDVDVNDTHTWSVSNDGKGKCGTFTVDQTGKWTYNLDPANTSVKELKTGESITETFTVYVDDGKGGKTPETITVKINGTNDGAIITPSKPGDDKGSVTEDDKLTANGKLDVVDPDKGEAVFKPQTDIGHVWQVLHRRQRQLEVRAQQQRSQVQALGAGEKLTETFEVVTADGNGHGHHHRQRHQ